MSNKRRNTSSPECGSPLKRRRHQAADAANSPDEVYDDAGETESDERPQINANTGQIGAFPGLTADDEVFYGPANDGIDYIRMVRSEAKGIPQMLRAQTTDHVSAVGSYKEEPDAEGYWDDDGTYTAKPDVHNDYSSYMLPKAQLQYYDSLLTQFTLVTATMRCVPPLSVIEKLTSSQPISFPAENKNARMSWGQCVKIQDPSPVQIACMDESSILELVRLITVKMRGLFQDERQGAAQRLGAWLWAVLGKCPDRGELGSEEISDLRQLAQKAVDVQNWLEKKSRPSHVFVDTERDDEEEEEEEEGEEEEERATAETDVIGAEIRAAKQRLSRNADNALRYGDDDAKQQNGDHDASKTRHQSQRATQEKLVVLDMILTVVGEVYGQRDLLEYRRVWNTNSV